MPLPVAHTPKGKVTAKAESKTLLKAWEGRAALWVFNPSAKEVWLALGPTAAKEEGIWLKKESGAVYIEGYRGEVSCVTTEGEGTVTYSEL